MTFTMYLLLLLIRIGDRVAGLDGTNVSLLGLHRLVAEYKSVSKILLLTVEAGMGRPEIENNRPYKYNINTTIIQQHKN